jgi:uncharacterized OB-fold protein
MTGYRIPDPNAPDFAPFWQGCREGRLLVQRCANGHLSWPPRPACPRCQDLTRDWVEVAGFGWLYSWTVVHRTPMKEFARRTPYAVAIVELCANPVLRMLGRCLGDPAKLRLGMPLRVWFEPVTDQFSLPVWQPAEREE